MKCNKCPRCEVEPTIREGKPVEIAGKPYWKQIISCADTHSPHYGEDIGEVNINIFDQSIIEKEL